MDKEYNYMKIVTDDFKYDLETKFQTWANGTLDKLNVHYYHIVSKNKYVKKGIPDLLCWYNEKSFVIELKVGRNTLSDEQIIERDKFIKQGIPYYTCYTPKEVMDVLKKIKVIKL